jgi:hypothetical protein
MPEGRESIIAQDQPKDANTREPATGDVSTKTKVAA